MTKDIQPERFAMRTLGTLLLIFLPLATILHAPESIAQEMDSGALSEPSPYRLGTHDYRRGESLPKKIKPGANPVRPRPLGSCGRSVIAAGPPLNDAKDAFARFPLRHNAETGGVTAGNQTNAGGAR